MYKLRHFFELHTVILLCFWLVPYILLFVLIVLLSPSQVRLRIACGRPGGFYLPMATELTTMLKDHASRRFREIEVIQSNGSEENIGLIQTGKTDLAFAQDGLPAGEETRSLLYLFDSPLHIVCRREKNPTSIHDLKLKRVYLGPARSGTRMVSKLIVQLYGLQDQIIDVGEDWNFQQAAEALKQSKVDAAFFLVAVNSEAINSLAEMDGEFDLVEVARSKSLEQQYPFLRTTTIYKGTYAGSDNFPTRDIVTISTREVLICRSDLAEKDAVLILRTILDHLSTLTARFPLASQISRIDPQGNFYYPLHPGALAVYQQTDSNSYPPSFWLALSGFLITQVLTARYAPSWWRDRNFRYRLHQLFEGLTNKSDLMTSGSDAFTSLSVIREEIEDAYLTAKISKEHHDRLNALIEKIRRDSTQANPSVTTHEPTSTVLTSPSIDRIDDESIL